MLVKNPFPPNKTYPLKKGLEKEDEGKLFGFRDVLGYSGFYEFSGMFLKFWHCFEDRGGFITLKLLVRYSGTKHGAWASYRNATTTAREMGSAPLPKVLGFFPSNVLILECFNSRFWFWNAKGFFSGQQNP